MNCSIGIWIKRIIRQGYYFSTNRYPPLWSKFFAAHAAGPGIHTASQGLPNLRGSLACIFFGEARQFGWSPSPASHTRKR